MVVPLTTGLQFLVVHPSFWLSVLLNNYHRSKYTYTNVSFGYRFMVVPGAQTTKISNAGCKLAYHTWKIPNIDIANLEVKLNTYQNLHCELGSH